MCWVFPRRRWGWRGRQRKSVRGGRPAPLARGMHILFVDELGGVSDASGGFGCCAFTCSAPGCSRGGVVAAAIFSVADVATATVAFGTTIGGGDSSGGFDVAATVVADAAVGTALSALFAVAGIAVVGLVDRERTASICLTSSEHVRLKAPER